MLALVDRVGLELERILCPRPAPTAAPRGQAETKGKIEAAYAVVAAAAAKGKPALAYSGGSDSVALLELAVRAGLRPTIIWADTGMEYPETRAFVKEQAAAYGLELRIAKAPRTPIEQWQKTGWPFLGKMAARNWTMLHANAGFALNCSECCRSMKIGPARKLTKNLGCVVQLTGQRGRDDRVRGMRNALEGPIAWQDRDRMWIANPLAGWTDQDVETYAREHNLPEHPAKARGAATIGCVFCGGGSQFENSGIRILRETWPEAWDQLIVEWGGGAIILAIKYGVRLEVALAAIKELGGLEQLATERPWIFDFTRLTPRAGYAKGARPARSL